MAARRSLLARLVRGVAGLAVALIVISTALIVLFRWVPVPLTAFMARDVVLSAAAGEFRYAHDWVGWDRISPNAAIAVVAAEDQRFAYHLGFDVPAIEKAWRDAQRGRRQRGASTISQQTAKNLFLWPGQSWLRKGLEAWFTLQIEVIWPKQRILEVYLNSAEFGPGVWGVEAASRKYFRKPAKRLSREQAALLAAVLPNPKRYRVDRPSPYVQRRQQWILRQMSQLGGASYLEAMDEPVDEDER
jgi:monofunctional biosynthetic peptidoglycan transglycosylase